MNSDELISVLMRGMPEIVYHYTSLQALLGILKSEVIWATDIAYLNDKIERTFFLKMADELLPQTQYGRRFLRPLFQSTEEIASNTFVTSFSSISDSLNHFDRYAPPGNGVAIGFYTRNLLRTNLHWRSGPRETKDKATSDLIRTCSFKKISYIGLEDKQYVIAKIEEGMSFATEFMTEYPSSDEWVVPDLEDVLRDRLEEDACFSKHQNFASEEEYRLLYRSVNMRTDAHLLNFRIGSSTLVPYVEISIPPASIAEIVVGPSPDAGLTLNAVKAFCASLGGRDIDVKPSRLSLRNW